MLNKEKRFYFDTIDETGNRRQGVVSASSPQEVAQRLCDQGFYESNVYEVAPCASPSQSDRSSSITQRTIRQCVIHIIILVISAIIYVAISR